MDDLDLQDVKAFAEATKKEDSGGYIPENSSAGLDVEDVKTFGANQKYETADDQVKKVKDIGVGFGEYLSKKYQDGNTVMFQGTYGSAVLDGEITYEQAKEQYNAKEVLNAIKYEGVGEVAWKDSFVKRGLGETAQATPHILNTAGRGTAGAIIGAGLGFGASLAADALGFGLAVPDEIVTGGNLLRVLGLEAGKKYTAGQIGAIAGGRIGATVSTTPYMFKIERGNAYMGFREKGLSHEGSAYAANTYGAISAGLELMGLDVLAAPFRRKILKEGVDKGLKSAFGKTMLEYSKTIGKEMAIEDLQTNTELFARGITAWAEANENANVSFDEFMQANLETLAATAATMTVFGGLGAGFDYNTYSKVLKENIQKQIEIEESKKNVSAIISTDQGGQAFDLEGVESSPPTFTDNKEGYNAGNGVIDIPSINGQGLNPSERHIVNSKIKQLRNSVKNSDKEIAKAEKEYTKLKADNKDTTDVENRIAQLHDNKDFADAEIQSILNGDKKISDIAAENIKKEPDKTLSMRSKQIDTEISQVNQDIKDAEKVRSIAKQGGKSITRIVEKLANLNDKLDALNNEKALIKSGGLQTSEYYLPGAPIKGQVNLQNYRKQKIQQLKNNISNYIKGVKEGSKQQTIETKQIHAAVEGMLKDAGLRINERGEFINTLKNIQTIEDLQRDQNKINKKVKEIIEKRNKGEALKQLKKYTKLAKPLKGNKPVGKMTADIQNRLSHILNIANKNLFDSELAQQEIREKAAEQGRELTPAEEQQIADLQIAGGIKERTSRDINALNKELAHLIETGRTLRQEQLTARREAREQLVKDAIESAQGNKPLGETEVTPDTLLGRYKVYTAKSFVKWFRTAGGALTNNWFYRLDMIAMHDKNVALPKLLDYFPSFKKFTENTDRYMNQVSDKFKEIYGQKDEKSLLNKLKELSTPADLFRYIDQDGKSVVFKGSKLDAITIHLWLQNPETRYLLKKNGATIRDWMGQTQIHKGFTTVYNEDLDGQYMREKGKEDTFRYSNENSIEAQVANILSDNEKAFGDYMLDFLGGEYYDHVNEWYRNEHAADLTKTDFYFPRDTETIQNTEEKDISKYWGTKMISATSGAVKNRTMHSKPLRIDNAYKVMINHISDMEFMSSYNDFFKNGMAVLSDLKFRQVVEGKFGRLLFRDMKKHFGEIIQRNSAGVPYVEDIISFFRKNISSAYIGFNPRSALKQMLAFPIYSSEIPTGKFITGLADFAKNPIGNAKFLYENSALLRAREGNITIEMQEISRDPSFANFVKTGSIRDHFYLLTKYGDVFNTVLGGWASYKYNLSRGQTHEQAIENMERLIYKYNQTTNMEELSNMQRGSGLGKLLGMFGSDAAKQFNASISAMRSFQRGSISKTDFIKRMYILQVHLPVAMLAANLVMPSRVALLTAVTVGSTSFLPYMGEYMSAMWTAVLKNVLSGDDDDKKKDKIYFNNVGMDVMGEITKGFKELAKVSEKGWYYNNWYDAYTRLGEPFVQGLTGAPSKNTRKFFVDPSLNLLGIDTEGLTSHNKKKK